MTPSQNSGPDDLRARWIPVAGDSMWPSLRSGDQVFCEAISTAHPGEIVVARLPGGIVAHRVISWSRGRVILRGDNCEKNDAEIAESCVLGRVVKVRRAGSEHRSFDRGPSRLGLLRRDFKRAVSALVRRAS
ncbi:MAG: helix-turn-helix transcriptional regulator [Myxococcaceae bacterium]